MGRWLDGARAVRAAMDLAGAQLNDVVALDAMAVYPAWEIGKAYAVNDRRRRFSVQVRTGAYITSGLEA